MDCNTVIGFVIVALVVGIPLTILLNKRTAGATPNSESSGYQPLDLEEFKRLKGIYKHIRLIEDGNGQYRVQKKHGGMWIDVPIKPKFAYLHIRGKERGILEFIQFCNEQESEKNSKIVKEIV